MGEQILQKKKQKKDLDKCCFYAENCHHNNYGECRVYSGRENTVTRKHIIITKRKRETRREMHATRNNKLKNVIFVYGALSCDARFI